MSSMPPSLPSFDVALHSASDPEMNVRTRTYTKHHRETLHATHVGGLKVALEYVIRGKPTKEKKDDSQQRQGTCPAFDQ